MVFFPNSYMRTRCLVCLKRVFLCLRLTIKILQINAALYAKSFCAAPPKNAPGGNPGCFILKNHAV